MHLAEYSLQLEIAELKDSLAFMQTSTPPAWVTPEHHHETILEMQNDLAKLQTILHSGLPAIKNWWNNLSSDIHYHLLTV